jgi:hypothetical protein
MQGVQDGMSAQRRRPSCTPSFAHYQADGTSLRFRAGHIHDLPVASPFAPFVNLGMRLGLDAPVKKALGVAPERSLSPFAARRSPITGAGISAAAKATPDARQDHSPKSFTSTTTCALACGGEATEAAGFEVVKKCRVCRPPCLQGSVEGLAPARRNVEVLSPRPARNSNRGTEPSCILTLRDEYRDLLPDDADVAAIAREAYMIDEFLAKLDQTGDLGIVWKDGPGPDVLFHGHCHQKALIGMGPSMTMLATAGCTATESGAGCCGMAGSFGYEAEHYDVSRKIGEERLFPAVATATAATTISIAGVSCRQQIEHFTDRGTKHIAEVLAERIAPGHTWTARAPEPVPAEVAPTAESVAHARNTGAGPA